MFHKKMLTMLVIALSLFSCSENDEDEVQLVPQAANEIRLISSKGIYPHITFRSAVLNGDYAYLAIRSWAADASGGGLYVYSLAGLDGVATRNIQEQQFIAINHPTDTMARSGDTLFVGGEGGISVFDISNPALPALLTTINDSANFSLKVYNQTLYVIEAQTVKLYDISTASTPVYLTTISGSGFNAAVANGYLYSGAGINSSFRIRDINNPTTTIATVGLAGIPYHIEVVQNYLVVISNTNSASTVRVYSLANPTSVSLTDQVTFDFPMKAFASDGQELVLSSYDLGEVFQITNQGTVDVLHTIANGSATTVDGFPYFAAIEANRALIPGDDYALLYRF